MNADWLWESRWGVFFRRTFHAVIPIATFALSLWVIKEAERHMMPVVTRWSLDYIHREGNHFTMGGTLFKDRNCQLVNTAVVGVPRNPILPRVVVYQVAPNELLGADVPVGQHTWGPWEVRIPKTLIQYKDEILGLEVVGRHRCNALWLQETTYGFVPIERVPL